MTVSELFDRSFTFFSENSERITRQYKGKIIAIYCDQILGTYKSKMEAFHKVPKDHNIPSGSFLIKDCSENSERYVRVYNSSISFSK